MAARFTAAGRVLLPKEPPVLPNISAAFQEPDARKFVGVQTCGCVIGIANNQK